MSPDFRGRGEAALGPRPAVSERAIRRLQAVVPELPWWLPAVGAALGRVYGRFSARSGEAMGGRTESIEARAGMRFSRRGTFSRKRHVGGKTDAKNARGNYAAPRYMPNHFAVVCGTRAVERTRRSRQEDREACLEVPPSDIRWRGWEQRSSATLHVRNRILSSTLRSCVTQPI